jgi:ribosomal protein S18 acetylase RimI-like enzyme
MEIRKAREEDLDQILDIWWNDLMQYHSTLDKKFYALKPKKEAMALSRKHKQSFFGKRKKTLFVAVENEEVLGFCACGVNSRPPIYKYHKECIIGDIAVSRNHRRKGVGTALLKEVKKWGKAKGAGLAEVRVAVKNKTALGLYKKAGFNENKYMMEAWLK